MAVIDDVSYARLLARAVPRVIETDAANERASAALEQLDSPPRMTPAQKRNDWLLPATALLPCAGAADRSAIADNPAPTVTSMGREMSRL